MIRREAVTGRPRRASLLPLPWLWLVLCCLPSRPAAAQEFSLHGIADLRVVIPSGQASNAAGGFGKLRWGSDDPTPLAPEFGSVVLSGAAQVTPELVAVAELRGGTQQQTAIDLLDAFVRYRPVSITRWRWSAKGGAFFVPVSLENTGIGWSSEWTLTPSAINTWVGDELRTIGGEGQLEWRGDVDHLVATFALFGWNQPAGVALAERGWTFDDNPLGLLGHLRLPDAVAEQRAAPGQPYGALYSAEFRQIDGNPGWYAGIAWDRPDLGRIALLRYDNMADPSAHEASTFAWHTKFWSLGASTQVYRVVLLAQAMVGSTEIAPTPAFSSTTDFWAGYLLAGYQRGAWRYAARIDAFATDERHPGPSLRLDERGFAVTAAVTWTPRRWLQCVAEVLAVDYTREQRTLEALPPHAVEIQTQLAIRLLF